MKIRLDFSIQLCYIELRKILWRKWGHSGVAPTIHILGLHIPSYFLMLLLGMIAFFSLFFLQFRRLMQEDRVTFNRLLFVLLLSIGCLGVSAFFFNSLFHSIKEGKIVFGGITWLGGVVGAIAAFLFFTHILVPKKKGYALETLSQIMPGLSLGHGFGRIGCFLGGCCYGRVSDSYFSVVYPAGSHAAQMYPNADGTGSLPVLPVPLWEAFFEFLLFFLMLLLPKKAKKYCLSIYCVCYSIFRFVAEFYRGDARGSVGGTLSPSQLLSIFLLLFGIFLFLEMGGICFKKLHNKRLMMQQASDALPITRLESMDDAALLRQIHGLYLEGVLTQEEYEAKKKEILERM